MSPPLLEVDGVAQLGNRYNMPFNTLSRQVISLKVLNEIDFRWCIDEDFHLIDNQLDFTIGMDRVVCFIPFDRS